MHSMLRRLGLALGLLLLAQAAGAAGTLTPIDSPDAPIEIRDHHADVVIEGGFARTEVTQTFFNPNPSDLEALYAFPVPKGASLAEVSIQSGEIEIHGEVLPREEAERLYGVEKSAGNEAGLATKESYQRFEFRVFPVRAQSETRVRFRYYQPVEIDTGVGRYLYPLEEGGTDEVAEAFWLRNDTVTGSFSVALELRSGWPVVDVRTPGFEGAAVVEELGEGHHRVRIEQQGAKLARDFVFYWRLADDLPGRVEVVPYRAAGADGGTFMMVVTPGIDLQPLAAGVDWVFVLDASGSMNGKIATLARGVGKALGELRPEDRFRLVTFSNRAHELTPGFVPATPEAVQRWLANVQQIQAGGSTNLYEGLELGLERLDDDRATNLILVTDAVTNTGIVEPKRFHALMQKHDIRVFGFLMGNSANWPLMRTITGASGGFADSISNGDDLVGKVLLAKSKVTHEALHGVEVKIRGVETHDVTGAVIPKVYRGQQLVLFGKYAGDGEAKLAITARMTGEDKTYATRFAFPEVAEDHPELERLWALAKIEELEDLANAGLLPPEESKQAVQDLGVAHQIVTDETAMVVLSDEAFTRHGVERRNQARTATEHAAQARRRTAPIANHRVDSQQPAFPRKAPRLGGGSGAIDPVSGLIGLGLAAGAFAARRRRGSA